MIAAITRVDAFTVEEARAIPADHPEFQALPASFLFSTPPHPPSLAG
jgi:hypothetical protein